LSVNKYDSTTGTLTTLASGGRTWIGTKAQYDAQRSAGTLPNNCMICITDDEVDYNHYSTDETFTGMYWIDGKKIYQKTVDLGSNVTISSTTWTPISALPITDIDLLIKTFGIHQEGTMFWLNCGKGTSYLQFIVARNDPNAGVRYITVQYTKTTD
jgi:hypothetical protein